MLACQILTKEHNLIHHAERRIEKKAPRIEILFQATLEWEACGMRQFPFKRIERPRKTQPTNQPTILCCLRSSRRRRRRRTVSARVGNSFFSTQFSTPNSEIGAACSYTSVWRDSKQHNTGYRKNEQSGNQVACFDFLTDALSTLW